MDPMGIYIYTWWLIPLSKWVITPVINGISRVNPLITGVIILSSSIEKEPSDRTWFWASSPFLPLPPGMPGEMKNVCCSRIDLPC